MNHRMNSASTTPPPNGPCMGRKSFPIRGNSAWVACPVTAFSKRVQVGTGRGGSRKVLSSTLANEIIIASAANCSHLDMVSRRALARLVLCVWWVSISGIGLLGVVCRRLQHIKLFVENSKPLNTWTHNIRWQRYLTSLIETYDLKSKSFFCMPFHFMILFVSFWFKLNKLTT